MLHEVDSLQATLIAELIYAHLQNVMCACITAAGDICT